MLGRWPVNSMVIRLIYAYISIQSGMKFFLCCYNLYQIFRCLMKQDGVFFFSPPNSGCDCISKDFLYCEASMASISTMAFPSC